MATTSECRAAVDRLAELLERNADARGKVDLNRRLSLEIPDLGTGFHGQLKGGRLTDVADGTDPSAKIKITARSDDFVALVDGSLGFAQAWASGRISVDAGIFDLMKLRSLL